MKGRHSETNADKNESPGKGNLDRDGREASRIFIPCSSPAKYRGRIILAGTTGLVPDVLG